MKKKRNLYIIAFLCFITLVGVTIAYLGSTSVLENIFEAGTYKTVTHEEFISPSNWLPGDTTPKTITTTNEGTIPVMVRVKFDEEWTSKNNDDLPLTYNDENVSLINLDNLNDWIYKDGYYYYLSELAPGETTSSLIKSVTFNPNVNSDVSCTSVDGTVTCESTGDGYDGATYKLKITTETVQAKNYETIWEDVPIMYDYVGDNPCTYNGELEVGTEYVNGQYTYKYRQEWNYDQTHDVRKWINTLDDGWSVKLTDTESTDSVITPLCTSVNNKPIVSFSWLFFESNANSIDLSSFDNQNVKSMSGMFAKNKTNNLDFDNFDTSNVIDMSYMFSSNDATSLDLSDFDTRNVKYMDYMFRFSKATTIDLSSFDTSNVTNMRAMFNVSEALNLDLTNFDTSNVTNMSGMFARSKLTNLNISNFDTSKVTNMSAMFAMINYAQLDLSNFDTSNVTSMSSMFSGSKINTLNIISFDTSKVTNMRAMFANTTIPVLDLSSFNTSNVTDITGMFLNASARTGYARTQSDADKFNTSSNKPSGLTFVVKNS